MTLYPFHPVLDFLLTIYAAYIITLEFKTILNHNIDSIREQTQQSITACKANIERIRTSILEKLEHARTIQDSAAFINKCRKKLNEIDAKAKLDLNIEKFDNHFNNEKTFNYGLKPYFVFFCMYCFTGLVVSGFYHNDLEYPDCVNSTIIIFNFIFGLTAFVYGARRITANAEFPSSNKAIFSFLIILAISILVCKKFHDFDRSNEVAVISTLIIATFPIILIFLKMFTSGETANMRVSILINQTTNSYNILHGEVEVEPQKAKEAMEKLNKWREGGES